MTKPATTPDDSRFTELKAMNRSFISAVSSLCLTIFRQTAPNPTQMGNTSKNPTIVESDTTQTAKYNKDRKMASCH